MEQAVVNWKQKWEEEKIERQRLEKLLRSQEERLGKKDKYRWILDNTNLGIVESDLRGVTRFVNDYFCEMTAYEEKELIAGESIIFMFPKEFHLGLKDRQRELRKGISTVFEAQITRKDGRLIWTHINGIPLFGEDGTITGVVLVFMDTTSRKKLQTDLLQSKLKAEAAQKAEKEFLAHMSHEIRTPLNAIIGMSHLLYDTQPTHEQKNYLDTLKNAGNILHKLINDILDFSKIEAGGVEVVQQPFDLYGMLNALKQTFELKTKSKEVEFWAFIDDQIDTLLIGDELLLQRILLNLLGNASKFTEKGSITLDVQLEERFDEDLLLSFKIIDTGIGIPRDRQEAIFENFKQASNTTSIKYGGTGLGLAITKQLVDLLEGMIYVDSALGIGTTFTVELPFKDSNIRRTEEKEKGKPSDKVNEQSELLIVEDNEMNRSYIGGLLRKWNIKFDMAEDGLIAVEKARHKLYDMIIMDIRMPNMNGYDATIAIRNQKNLNQETPIIALTASAMESEKYKALDIGMNEFLTKPFAPEKLKMVLCEYLPVEDDGIGDKVTDDTFEYDSRLNVKYLIEIYEDDFEYACDMFGLFLEGANENIKLLWEFGKAGQWPELRALAHKVKPAFSMVGLTWLTDKASELESKIDELDYESALELLDEILTEFEQYLPVINRQHELLEKQTS